MYTEEQLIKNAEDNIRRALADYGEHTSQHTVLEDVSDAFIERLARDSVKAKQSLRELFSQSPVWDEDLDALVINGTRTHDPDYEAIYDMALKMTCDYRMSIQDDVEKVNTVTSALRFFSSKDAIEKGYGTLKMNSLVPDAYVPGKKPSRVFRSFSRGLGIVEDEKYRKIYAQFADELSSRKLNFKLFVSLNPAHFLTMSNPKGDTRGNMLTSCHSLNCTDYEYNNGCTGYARDGVTMIAFTVADPTDASSLNNRKNTRQIFAYKPGNGVLLQSRMYNVDGGVHGTDEKSKLYRDLIQREIAELEGETNLWKTYKYCNGHEDTIEVNFDFGGYTDWTHECYDGRVSIFEDRLDSWEPLTVGAAGLCVSCGEETSYGMFCDDCGGDHATCDECGERYLQDDLYDAYDSDGNEMQVCEDCRDIYYIECEDCGDLHHENSIIEVVDVRGYTHYYCPDCVDNYSFVCHDCGERHHNDYEYTVHDKYGDEISVCENCVDNYSICDYCDELYTTDDCTFIDDVCVCPDCKDREIVTCHECGEEILADNAIGVHDADDNTAFVCEDCAENKYSECDICGEYYPNDAIVETDDNICPNCAKSATEQAA